MTICAKCANLTITLKWLSTNLGVVISTGTFFFDDRPRKLDFEKLVCYTTKDHRLYQTVKEDTDHEAVAQLHDSQKVVTYKKEG